ncbi:hypothetical protein NC651_017592 [Populus alba x Populus x berolinensis]|nr:hypothetical protein NC651_017592 [Populus alba x Populus x berolinensis]
MFINFKRNHSAGLYIERVMDSSCPVRDFFSRESSSCWWYKFPFYQGRELSLIKVYLDFGEVYHRFFLFIILNYY